MMGPPNASQAVPKIEAAVTHVLSTFSPAIRSVHYFFDQDWTGDWAIRFRVILSDEAADTRRRELASRIPSEIMDHIDYPNLGLFPYVRFRSESEQAMLKDPEWEPLELQNGVR